MSDTQSVILQTVVAAASAVAAFAYQKKISIELFTLWVTWMVTGGVFYKERLGVSWARGFYHAVSVGYSIGWGDVSEDGREDSKGFSIFYLCCGASFVGVAFGAFGNYISKERDNWYTNELQRIALNTHAGNNIPRYIYSWCVMQREVLSVVLLWLGFVFSGAIMAFHFHRDDHWGFTSCLYFAISSLSTGGLYPIHESAADWEYGLIAVYCAVGVPIMGAAMGGLASLFLDLGNVETACKQIREPITEEEIAMLVEFGIANKDAMPLNKLEFLVLCIVRIGVVSPELVKFIFDYFHELDKDGNGTLSVEELCQRLSTVSREMSDRLLKEAARQLSEKQLSTGGSGWFRAKNSLKVKGISAFALGSSKKKVHAEPAVAMSTNSVLPSTERSISAAAIKGESRSSSSGSGGGVTLSPSIRLADIEKALASERLLADGTRHPTEPARDPPQPLQREGDTDWRRLSPMKLSKPA